MTAGPFTRPQPEPGRAARLIDEAIALLGSAGIVFEDDEAEALLEASGVILRRAQGRLLLRPQALRQALDGPAAFSLYDRVGRKVHDLVGGPAGLRLPALHATLTEATTLIDNAGDGATPLPPGARLPIRGEGALGAFDLIGCAPPLEDCARAYGEIHRFFGTLVASPRPQIYRPGDPEALDALREMLSTLRGSVTEAEARPYVVLEAVATGPMTWDRRACRVMVDAARLGVPLAAVPAPPAAGDDPARWIEGAVASLLAARLLHARARRGAPWLWGLPLLQRTTTGEPWLDLLGLALDAAQVLQLPTLVTPVTRAGDTVAEQAGELAPLWALQAVMRGASLVVWGGLTSDAAALSLDHLRSHARLLPEIRRVAHGGGPRRSWRDGDEPIDPQRWQALADVVRRAGVRHGPDGRAERRG